MSENTINHLRRLLKILKKGEKKSLRTYLMSFHQMYGDYSPKTLELLDLMEENPRAEQTLLKERINPLASDNTFRMLIMRLRYKTLESLTLDLNLKRSDSYSLGFIARVEGRKLLSQAEIIHSRGLSKEAITLYKKVLRSARKYELFDLWIEALHLKGMLLLMQDNAYSSQGLINEKHNVEIRRNYYYQCKSAFYRFANEEHFNAVSGYAPKEQINALELLEAVPQNHQSTSAFYWLQLFRLNTYERQKNYDLALKSANELLQFIKVSPAVMMNRRLGSVRIHLAFNRIQLAEYQAALIHLKRAEKAFEAKSYNFLMCQMYKGIIYFHLEEYNAAIKKFKGLINQREHFSVFDLAKLHFYLGASLCKAGDYRKAHLALQHTKALDADRNGWNTGVRILIIMNQIEWGGLDLPTEAFIDNLHSHLRETRKRGTVSMRQEKVHFILLKLAYFSFDFIKAKGQCIDALNFLQSEEGRTEWDPLGVEIVCFDVWFLQMYAKQQAVRIQVETIIK